MMSEKVFGIQEAYKLALKGNSKALDELSGYANGGSVEARKHLHQIEDRKIVFTQAESPKGRSNLVEVLIHPIRSVRTKFRQMAVACDLEAASTGSNQEDFPELSLQKAAQLMEQKRGGVQLEDWSKRDQEKLKRGERPRGTPIHRDI